MIPFHESMYPDDIVYYRRVPVTGGMGDSKRAFPTAGVESKARVQSKDANRTDATGRVYTVTVWRIITPEDVDLGPDDKVEYLGRTLAVEGRTLPKGLGNVTWLTQCVETK